MFEVGVDYIIRSNPLLGVNFEGKKDLMIEESWELRLELKSGDLRMKAVSSLVK